jgi:hypothetical protein
MQGKEKPQRILWELFLRAQPRSSTHLSCPLFIPQSSVTQLQLGARGTHCLHSFCSTIHNSWEMETMKASMNEWLDKENVPVLIEYYSAITKKEVQSLATARIGLKTIMLRKIRQAQKDENCMISFIWGVRKVDLPEGESRTVVTGGPRV